MRKIIPPAMTVIMIAFGMMFTCLASFVYIVTASKPMKEKHTTVAPVSTALNSTPSWTKGSGLNTVPAPSPALSWAIASTQYVTMRTREKTSRIALMFAVPRIEDRTMPVTMTVYATTHTHGGASGTIDSM